MARFEHEGYCPQNDLWEKQVCMGRLSPYVPNMVYGEYSHSWAYNSVAEAFTDDEFQLEFIVIIEGLDPNAEKRIRLHDVVDPRGIDTDLVWLGSNSSRSLWGFSECGGARTDKPLMIKNGKRLICNKQWLFIVQVENNRPKNEEEFTKIFDDGDADVETIEVWIFKNPTTSN